MSWKLEEAIAYYKTQGAPSDQTALIALLREVQAESGGRIPLHVLAEIAASFKIKEALLRALIRRIPSLRLGENHCLELCAGPNCGKHTALAAYAEKLCGSNQIVLKYVPCMRLCGKGPNLKWDGKLYHNADEALIRRLVEGK